VAGGLLALWESGKKEGTFNLALLCNVFGVKTGGAIRAVLRNAFGVGVTRQWRVALLWVHVNMGPHVTARWRDAPVVFTAKRLYPTAPGSRRSRAPWVSGPDDPGGRAGDVPMQRHVAETAMRRGIDRAPTYIAQTRASQKHGHRTNTGIAQTCASRVRGTPRMDVASANRRVVGYVVARPSHVHAFVTQGGAARPEAALLTLGYGIQRRWRKNM
jgi:hypothetical protein